MSHNRITYDGLAELYAGLRALAPDAAAEAGPIVTGAGNDAAAAIVAAYPERSGKLRGGVKVRRLEAGTYGATAEVRNSAKLANIFEIGTQARHTDLGADRGSMPAGRVFVPIVIAKRRAMYDALKGVLQRQGLEVSGDA